MLSHEEEATLAAMEARLRSESPDLHALFDQGRQAHPSSLPAAGDPVPRPSATRRVARIVVAALAATAATALATLAVGPELGGFVGALAFPVVGLYGWSQLTGHGRR